MELFFLPIAFISEVIGTMAGFGSATVAQPLALFFLDFKTALALVAFLHAFGSIGKLLAFRGAIDRRLLLRFGLPSVVCTAAGALLAAYAPPDLLKTVLGAFLAVFAVFSWRKQRTLPSTTTVAVIGGGSSGFLAGLIGTGGAMRGAFLMSFGLPKERYIATAAAIALAVDVTRIPLYVSQGFFAPRHYWMLPFIFVVAVAGSYIGRHIVKKIPQEAFRKLVLAAVFLIGCAFIVERFI